MLVNVCDALIQKSVTEKNGMILKIAVENAIQTVLKTEHYKTDGELENSTLKFPED